MSADESFSSSDESNESSSLIADHHLTCNHRLAAEPDPEQNQKLASDEEEIDDLFPLIDQASPFELFTVRDKTNRQEYLLVCKAYFAIFFLMVALLALCVLFLNHLSDVSAKQNGQSHFNGQSLAIHQINLDQKDRFHLFWSVDYDRQTILFQLRLQLMNGLDWFALGFSGNGSLADADLCMIWSDKRRQFHLQDVSTDNDSVVHLDHHSNDCQLVKNKYNHAKKVLYVAFRRSFETCDPEDYVIDNGTTHLVYAKGKGPISAVDSLRLVNHQNGFQRVQLLKPPITGNDMMNEGYLKTLELLVDNVTVPNVHTTYWCQLRKLPELFRNKIHMVQYEAVISNSSQNLVHHMELFHCEVDAKLVLPDWKGSCNDGNMPAELFYCRKVVAAWAYGAGPMIYPEQVGFPIGGTNYSLYLMIEVHYNNPELLDGLWDSSGIRIHYTDRLRQQDAGILEIGLEYSDKNSIPPGTVMELRGDCVSECTRVGLPADGIHIFASQLHTHLTGVSTWTEHVRGGLRLAEINRDNHYSPHFQEIRRLPMPRQVVPGDALVHVCRYDTRNRKQMTLGGLGITDEMCVNYLHYYPNSNLEVCKSSIDDRYLGEFFESMRIDENQNTSSQYPISVNYGNIQWTPRRVQMLYQLYQSAPLSVQCNQSSGHRFPGYWNGIPLTVLGRNSSQSSQSDRCQWVLRKKVASDDDEEEEETESNDYMQLDEDEPWHRPDATKAWSPRSADHQKASDRSGSVSRYQYLIDHVMEKDRLLKTNARQDEN